MGDLTINQFDLDEVADARKVELVGAIDAASITDLTNFVDKLYDTGTRWFLVDMRGIKYVNSTGLGSLVKYADQFTSRGGGMVLFALPPKVKVIIKMLGLDSFFPIVNSLDDALEQVRNQGQKEESEPAAPEAPVVEDVEDVEDIMDESPAVPQSSVAATVAPAPSSNGQTSVDPGLVKDLLDEQKRTNRLLKAVILELRQLRSEFDED